MYWGWGGGGVWSDGINGLGLVKLWKSSNSWIEDYSMLVEPKLVMAL